MGKYFQVAGTDHPGMKVYTSADLKLTDHALSFDDEAGDAGSRFGIAIPARAQGTLVALEAGRYQLFFSFNNRNGHNNVQQAKFWVKRRDFDRLFSRQ